MGECSSNAVDVCPVVQLSGRSLASLIQVFRVAEPLPEEAGNLPQIRPECVFQNWSPKAYCVCWAIVFLLK